MPHVNHLLGEYYDGELPIRRRQQVKAHLRDCPACRAELGQFNRVSDLMAEYTLPDSLTGAETFRAQVMLRVSRRRRAKASYPSWIWYMVPLSLGSLLIFLQASVVLLVVLCGLLGWQGIEVVVSLVPSWWQWIDLQTFWGDVFVSSWLGLFNLVVRVSLYLVLFLVLIPYAGWVGLLWRSVQKHSRLY